MSTNIQIIFTSVDSEEIAQTIAQAVIEARLAACVQILPGITSMYTWNGTLERSTEVLLKLKTAARITKDLIKCIEELHPYEVPEILAVDVSVSAKPYEQWLNGLLA